MGSRPNHLRRALVLMLLAHGAGLAQVPEQPWRVEVGGYGSAVDRGFGNWNGLEAQIWYRGNAFVVPVLLIESQTRSTGRHDNYSLFSYLNWTGSFYTTQSVSVAPRRNSAAQYFPDRRYDFRAHFKLPPHRNWVIAAGITHFDLAENGHGQIFNTGALYYRRNLVVEGNVFVNRNQPGNLYSGSGRLAAQYGREGQQWVGASIGGGREVYQYIGLTPIEARFSSYSVQVFYRRWLTRHVGFVITTDYVNKLNGYRRGAVSGRMFFEF